MIDFEEYPKQWLISETRFEEPVSGHSSEFVGFHIQAAKSVPVVTLVGADGADLGRLVGWAIDDDHVVAESTSIRLSEGDDLSTFFRSLSGRFVLLWRDDHGNILFREDSSGGYPAVFSAEHRVIASTVSVMERVVPLEADPEVAAIFQFPKRRGFLPFGLTSRRGVKRLMPNHVLDAREFTVERTWPSEEFLLSLQEDGQDARALTKQAAEKVQRNIHAILRDGKAVLNLSGGHDSRMVLAASRGHVGSLHCITFGEKGEINVHVGQKVASAAGVEHRIVSVLPVSQGDIDAWLHRSGYSMFDPVTEMAKTIEGIQTPGEFHLSGTGAELARATNWTSTDIGVRNLGVDTLMKRIRVPDVPVIRAAGQNWLDSIPRTADAATIMDIAKIEQIHGCWAGSAVYGHKIEVPTLYPFSGEWWNEIVLSLPQEFRCGARFYPEYMDILWPELRRIPINQAEGLDRFKFFKHEAKRFLPVRLKRWLKPLR